MNRLEIPQTREDSAFVDLCTQYVAQLRNSQERWGKILTDIDGQEEEILEVVLPENSEELGPKGKKLKEILDWTSEFKGIFKNFIKKVAYFKETLAKTPWGNLSHFAHNMGGSELHSFIIGLDHYRYCGEGITTLKIYIDNMVYYIDQVICHLESMLNYLGAPSGEKKAKERPEKTNIVQAIQAVMRARLFYGKLNIPGVSDTYADQSPKATLIGNIDIQSPIPMAQLVEMAYVPISNAHRIMSQDEHPETLMLETTVREIEYKGEKLLVIEFFNTGPLVDINALQRKILQLSDEEIAAASPHLVPRVQAIKRGSRQAILNAGEDALIIDGLTLASGGTGIGLNDLHRQLELNHGALLLNNVYRPRDGFCVTIILPQDETFDPRELIGKLRKLKKELQTGKYFLEKVEALAA